MAIDPQSKTLREYRQYYLTSVILVLLFSLIGLLVGLGIALHLSGVAQLDEVNFWIVMLAIFVISAEIGRAHV